MDDLDLDRACKLATAADALVSDPLARPLVTELKRLLEAARGHRAQVHDLNAERAKRDKGDGD